MFKNGIIKSTAELKAEIKKIKMNNKNNKLIDNINDNLRSHVKNMQLHMVYLHNNAIVQLNNLKLSTSDEQYINNWFQFFSKNKEYDRRNDTVTVRHIPIPSKSIKNIMFIHRKANKWDSKCNNISEDKAINLTKMSSHLVRLEAAPCVQVKSKFLPFLLDSGSAANILSYSSFTSTGFKPKFLDKSTKYNIKSSQGYQEDVILGTFTTKLVLKDSKGIPVLTNLVEFKVTKPHYFKENILSTPFFEHCKLSLSWTTSTPTVHGTFYKNNLNDNDPYETDLQLLENPRITNVNVIKLHPQTTTLIAINIGPSN